MNIKFVLKAISFSLVTSFVFASETNDCNEIKEYLEKKSLNYSKTIEKCSMNDQGKVTELKVNNKDLKEEDVNKILSYESIKNLEYIVSFEKEYPDKWITDYYTLLPHPGFSNFPSAIGRLPNLENLNFNYNHVADVKYTPIIERISIEDGLLNLSKSLKNLTLSQLDLSNQNLKELSTLINLEELELKNCVIDKDGFNSFENHKSLSKLNIVNDKHHEISIPKSINKIKSLKEIYLDEVNCGGSSFDFNGLDNLESLTIELTESCDFEMSKLTKLTNLDITGTLPVMSYRSDVCDKPASLELPTSLKNLHLQEFSFTTNNYEVISSLPNLEKLNLISCFYDEPDKFNIKSLKSHDKLYELIMRNINTSTDFLNDLVNLTYLELNNNDISEIPQLKNLKNLKHIDLNSNNLTKFPKELSTLKNLKYISFFSNKIYDEIPKSLNELENLKYFFVNNNAYLSGKVLTNPNLEYCNYPLESNICIPTGYELNCKDQYGYHLDFKSFKTCKEEKIIKESTNGQCGEGFGSCPSGQCCGKDGKCGTTDDYCLVSKNCQKNYGNCKDECEEIMDQLVKTGEKDISYIVYSCNTNEQGKVNSLTLNGNQAHLDQLVNLTDLESLTLTCIAYDNLKSLRSLKKLTTLIFNNSCSDKEEFPEDILYITSLKSLEIPYQYYFSSIPKSIKNLKNLETLNMQGNHIYSLPDEFGELENLKTLILSYNQFRQFPEIISNLKKLEELDLSRNEIYDELPESYNNLPELKSITLNDNNNVLGKTLQNEKLVTCIYIPNYEAPSDEPAPICRSGKEKCISEEHKKRIPLCSDSSNSSTEILDDLDDTATSTTTTVATTITTTTTTTTTTTATTTATTTVTITKKPEITEKPLSSEKSVTFEKPVTTKKSATTDKPVTTKKSATTDKPVTTKKSTTSNKSSSTKKSDSSEKQVTTKKSTTENPITTKKSAISEKPITTKKSAISEKPITTKKSATSEKPITSKKSSTTKKSTTSKNPITTKKSTISKKSSTIKKSTTSKKSSTTKKSTTSEKPVTTKKSDTSKKSSTTSKKQTTITKKISVTKKVSKTTSKETTSTNSKPSVKGSCGEGIGKCAPGYCCSKYGWCGKTDNYCSISKGCQSEFGICSKENASIKGKCGEGYGKCATGYCCSKYGWCGKTHEYCAVSMGCQSEFGVCSKENASVEGKCGEGYGKCAPGYCCSKYGWCGKSDAYCSIANGCQNKFGLCQ